MDQEPCNFCWVFKTELKRYHLYNLGHVSLCITFLKLINPLRTRTWKRWPCDKNLVLLKEFSPKKTKLASALATTSSKKLINKKLKILNGGRTSTICTLKANKIKWVKKMDFFRSKSAIWPTNSSATIDEWGEKIKPKEKKKKFQKKKPTNYGGKKTNVER